MPVVIGCVLLAGCGSEAKSPTGGGGADATGGQPGDGSSGGDTSTGGVEGGTGGSPSTGGNGASGGSEGSDFFGQSRCDSAGLLLCDGFEGDSIDTSLWTVEVSGSNTVEITTAEAARGSRSVHIRAQNGFGFLRTTSVFPVANNDYYGRMFLKVARYSTVDWAHWTVAEAAGTGDGPLIRVGGQYDTDIQKNRWGVGSDLGPTSDWTNRDQDPDGKPQEPPLGEWTCLEWLHKGSTHETRFYVDGVEHPSLYTSATQHGGNQGANYELPQFTSLRLGWEQYQSDPEPFDVWIDEVAVHTERIGCER